MAYNRIELIQRVKATLAVKWAEIRQAVELRDVYRAAALFREVDKLEQLKAHLFACQSDIVTV